MRHLDEELCGTVHLRRRLTVLVLLQQAGKGVVVVLHLLDVRHKGAVLPLQIIVQFLGDLLCMGLTNQKGWKSRCGNICPFITSLVFFYLHPWRRKVTVNKGVCKYAIDKR